jgi:hypothetical protein
MTGTPQTAICPACARSFTFIRTRRTPVYCQDATCARARQRDAAYRYFTKARAKGQKPARPTLEPLPNRLQARTRRDRLAAVIAERVEQARVARLARERASGQRTYTIESGWLQKPGAGDWVEDVDGRREWR